MKGKRFMLAKKIEGEPQECHFRLEEFDIPAIQDGEFSYEAIYQGVDPYMRFYGARVVGEKILNMFVIARVLESKHKDFPVDSVVVGPFGWATHGVSNGEGVEKSDHLEGLPASYLCGVLGMPGVTAYFGVSNILEPKPGQTVYINSAAGAVGAIAGQIAKLRGCRVVGSAGSEKKVKFLKDIGFDEAFNYKTVNLEEALKAACPNGIDCFFDGVGGMQFCTVVHQMNSHGRVAVCGCVSQYNRQEDPELCPLPLVDILLKMITVRGFIYLEFEEKKRDAFKQMVQWIKEGKLHVQEEITEGFENMPKVLIGLLQGKYIGKAIVKV